LRSSTSARENGEYKQGEKENRLPAKNVADLCENHHEALEYLSIIAKIIKLLVEHTRIRKKIGRDNPGTTSKATKVICNRDK
jgi:hypothetical protein